MHWTVLSHNHSFSLFFALKARRRVTVTGLIKQIVTFLDWLVFFVLTLTPTFTQMPWIHSMHYSFGKGLTTKQPNTVHCSQRVFGENLQLSVHIQEKEKNTPSSSLTCSSFKTALSWHVWHYQYKVWRPSCISWKAEKSILKRKVHIVDVHRWKLSESLQDIKLNI